MAINKEIYTTYKDRSQFNKVMDSLTLDSLTWQESFWGVKYLFDFCQEKVSNAQLISLLENCFNRGLTILADREAYASVRTMLSKVYLDSGNYEMSLNCSMALIDISEDMPPEVYLNLVEAEIHTDNGLKKIIKNSKMFFSDLHKADNTTNKYIHRQLGIVKKFLDLSAEFLATQKKYQIDESNIGAEVIKLQLTSTEEWLKFKNAVSGMKLGKSFKATTPKITLEPEVVITQFDTSSKDKGEALKAKELKKRPLVISVFPREDKDMNFAENNNENTNEITTPKSYSKNEDKQFEKFDKILTELMKMASENAQQIDLLKGKLNTSKDESETTKIKEELEEERNRRKEILGQSDSTKQELALSEDQKAKLEKQIKELEKTVTEQDKILEEKRSAEFTPEQIKSFEVFERVIVFDTCSIENQLDLLEYIKDTEMVRTPKTVISELEGHKKNRYDLEKSKMGQKALKVIHCNKLSVAFDYEDEYSFLLPEAYKINDEDEIGTINDKYIFSVALRYKLHTSLPVVLISDDITVQIMAHSEHIESMSAADFILGKEKYGLIIVPISEDEYLSKKFKPKEFSLSMNEILILQ